MEKIKINNSSIKDKNFEVIVKAFPGCITESVGTDGTIEQKIDFEKLKCLLSDETIDSLESYDFSWVGKKASIIEANRATSNTLRPCIEESVNWCGTENLYIEGDNLEALKILQESYLGRIKIIYIDPPYNTGNDFIYKDNFMQSSDRYAETIGTIDEVGNRFLKNGDSNGRFHSDWCSMIFTRLLIAMNVLSDDGVIFVSIDEHEIDNCLKIMDEVFGRANRVGVIVIKSNPRGSMSIGKIANLHEYLVVYAKDSCYADIIGHKLNDEMAEEYKYEDELGKYRLLGLRMRGGFWRRSERPNLYYPIFINPKTGEVSLNKDSIYSCEAVPVQPSTMEDGTWRWSSDKVKKDANLLIGKKVQRGESVVWDVYQKDYYDREGGRRTKAKSIWEEAEINYQNGEKEIKALFNNSVFDYSKPVFLIKKIIEMIGMGKSDIVMDFFSGSATTAHAVMELNAEDGSNRNFIMVQLPEVCDETSRAYKCGFKTICDIGRERIKRAAKKIHEEYPDAKFDDGFRVFKVDSSNMNSIGYSAGEMTQDLLSQTTSNIKADRTDLDLLFDCLLKEGVEITYPYSSETMDGCTVHDYNNGALIACFNENVTESVMREMASRKPIRAIFRDGSFKTDADRINVEEIFKLISPDTTVKVI